METKHLLKKLQNIIASYLDRVKSSSVYWSDLAHLNFGTKKFSISPIILRNFHLNFSKNFFYISTNFSAQFSFKFQHKNFLYSTNFSAQFLFLYSPLFTIFGFFHHFLLFFPTKKITRHRNLINLKTPNNS